MLKSELVKHLELIDELWILERLGLLADCNTSHVSHLVRAFL